MYAVLLLALCVTQDPKPQWLADKNAAYARMFNQQDFKGASSLYSADPVVIPPNADSFVLSTEIVSLLKAEYLGGLHNVSFQTELVRAGETELDFFEIGRIRPIGAYYFTQWTRKHGTQNWKASLNSILNTESPRQNPISGVSKVAPQWMFDLINDFFKKYNSGDFIGAAESFHESALFVPLSADKFVTKGQLPALLEEASKLPQFQSLTGEPVVVHQDESGLYHAICVLNRLRAPIQNFYIKMGPTDDGWKIVLQLFSIGTP